ncbi:unnamed protein product [Bursaphelenchus xylophilus]|uniref:COP9 signalosome complex subunit 4 n=1 Tax=Bursaphelenchus xylophilus TaxID=6326 RepID=A0A1I7S3Z7_BURXY|nr:unnamed protein product [Bursaphelenchus xylophilus]CAG9116588.1 unnamed protein product [Bursaphelenchus xylophilus]
MAVPAEEATEKMVEHLRAAETALQANDLEEAENNVTRASMLQAQISDENLMIRYKALYAQILDKNNRFAEAGLRYYDLSVRSQLTADEKTQALQNSVICTVLAPPGMHRTRLLKLLVKDDRVENFVGFKILQNMFMEKLISPDLLPHFEVLLKENQKIRDRDGNTILEKAVLQHNLLAVSRIYKCVSFDDVSELLGIAPELVETAVTRLISTGSLNGEVDQIDRLITFKEPEKKSPIDWNSYVISVCEQTNRVNELIATHHPEWHAQRVQNQPN